MRLTIVDEAQHVRFQIRWQLSPCGVEFVPVVDRIEQTQTIFVAQNFPINGQIHLFDFVIQPCVFVNVRIVKIVLGIAIAGHSERLHERRIAVLLFFFFDTIQI